jgi:hypothetical protein
VKRWDLPPQLQGHPRTASQAACRGAGRDSGARRRTGDRGTEERPRSTHSTRFAVRDDDPWNRSNVAFTVTEREAADGQQATEIDRFALLAEILERDDVAGLPPTCCVTSSRRRSPWRGWA